MIASASEDCTVKIWKIPDRGLTEGLNQPYQVRNVSLLSLLMFFVFQDLMRHQRKVGCVAWHPTASDVLVSAGADALVIVWNIESGDVLFEIDDLHTDLIYSISWNYNGSLFATTCKDKKLRVIDPRSQQLISVSNWFTQSITQTINDSNKYKITIIFS